MELVNKPYRLIPKHLKNHFFKLFKDFFSLFQKGRGKKLGSIKSILVNLYKNFNPLFLFFVILSLPIVSLIRILKPIKHIRFGKIQSWTIGQFSMVSETYLSRQKCGYDLGDTYDIFYLEGKPCNMQLYKMVKNKLRINKIISPLYYSNLLLPRWVDHLVPAPPYYSERDIDHSFINTNSQLDFEEQDNKKAMVELEKYGMSPEDKYVCLYVRDSGSSLNSSSIMYCFDINDFIYLAEILVERGYYVIRMGKGVKIKFKTTNNKIIDYAYKYQNDLMDIWLSKNCEFMVSTGGGVEMVAQIFRRPILYINCHDIFSSFRSDAFGSIVNFARLVRDGAPISLSEMISKIGLRKIGRMNIYKSEIDFDLEFQTQDEIITAVNEMILRINGEWIEQSDEKILNDKFWKIYKSWKRSDVMEWPFHQFHNEKVLCKIGYNYLKNNQEWLLR